MAVSRRLRFEILRRDNHTCRYCGAQAPAVTLTVDHVTPVALGGSDDPANLAAACADCNGGKTSIAPDSPHVHDVDERALRWADALKAAAAERAAAYNDHTRIGDQFKSIWNNWTIDHEPVDLPADWRGSVGQFMSAGLTMTDLDELVNVAMTARVAHHKVWRYFCGCCWRRAEQAQQRALELVETGPTSSASPGDGAIWTDAESVAYFWTRAQARLRDALGLAMHECMCFDGSTFCGHLACKSAVTQWVSGLLLRGKDLETNLAVLVAYDIPFEQLLADESLQAKHIENVSAISAALDAWRKGTC